METGLYLLLEYDYVENVVERRAPFRQGHLSALGAAKERGLLFAAGAVGDPPHGAVAVFADDREAVEAFVATDPYVLNGLVTAWRISPWNVVV